MPKVSIIIPVFGVEKYIERCARSLFEQTLEDIEYIFIDDCTQDNSIMILKKVVEEYPLRIEQTQIIKMPENSGLARVRRTGIQLASGDYIIHCDSDDWVAIDMYSAMFKLAVEEDSDLVVCDYYTTDGTDEKRSLGLFSTDKEQAILNMLFQKNSWSLCNKLFKRSVYNNKIIYPQDNMGEDMALTMQLIFYCDKISYLANALYFYYQNPSSITKSGLSENFMNRFIQACRNTKIVDTFYEKTILKSKVEKGLLYVKFKQRNLLLPIMNDKECFKKWLMAFPEINLKVFFCNNITLKEKLKFLLTFLRLYPIN